MRIPRPRRRLSGRMRLSLAYAILFLALGIVLTLVIQVGVRSSSSVAAHATPKPGVQLVTPNRPFPSLFFAEQHDADVKQVATLTVFVLVLAAILAIPLGWFASGRMLRPLRQITARAQTISARNLHERLALDGPEDEFKKLGDTLDQLLGRLDAAFETQRKFVANAAHELRTPLTVERTLLQVALADPDATAATLRATCEELLAAGRDQERLLESLLTLATSERGIDRATDVDIAMVAAGALAGRRARLEAAGLFLVEALDGAVVTGDRALLERLIANLLDNAIDYNVPGGRIEVRTGVDGTRPFASVANTGVLIGEGEVEQLFEPFRRLGAQRIGGDGGHHGLGLSIVRAVALAHGGEVEGRPRPDGGLTVIVRFPALAP